MLVEDGIVQWRDDRQGSADREKEVDLEGRALWPAFIDAHCHILPTGLDLQKLHLGDCAGRAEVLETVWKRHRERPDGWLLAVHYDQTKFPDGEHLTRSELDRISGDRPILLRHSNGHASVANSAALRAAGVDETTPDPPGGTYRRDASGRLDGVLLEMAHEIVSEASPKPTRDEMVEAILLAGERMAALGIGCASDMMTGRFDLLDELDAYRLAAERGCGIRTRLYLQWKPVFGGRRVEPDLLQERIRALPGDRCRVAGVKIFADGAIGSATAAIYGRYTGEAPAGPTIGRRSRPAASAHAETSGQLIYKPERLTQMVETAHEAGHQVAVHAIGDYAVDLVLDAFEATGEPSRHRIEHAMLLSDAQIERLARLNPFVTMQPEFLMRFGHAYRRQLGSERAAKLKRARSVLDAGIRLSFSSDRPIVPGDPRDGISAAVERPEGFDPGEAVPHEEALVAYTAAGAEVNGDGGRMGSLTPGQLADFRLDPR
jgi:predicted amidohydrolase YtcJ